MAQNLSPLANYLITQLDTKKNISNKEELEVNALVSELASWYEKLRNVIEYKEEEVVLRSAIERIVKRRVLLGGRGKTIAEPLIRELVWAKYLPPTEVPEQLIDKVTEKIELYEKLEQILKKQVKKNRGEIFNWTFQILTGEIENIISPSKDRELISNFIYQVFRKRLEIKDEEEQTKDVQVYIAVKRAFDKHDLPLLRYDLYIQYFGYLTSKNIEYIAENFEEFYNEANKQLSYPLRDTIHSYIKNKIPPFLILEEFFRNNKGSIRNIIYDSEQFSLQLHEIINKRYSEITKKVSTAIKRSVIFIFITKATLALSIEATFENLLFGSVYWTGIIVNILSSPFLMILSTFFINTPNKENTKRILENIQEILCEDNPSIGKTLKIDKNHNRLPIPLAIIYGLLWLLSLGLGVGAIVLVLSYFHFNIISQAIFIFFIIIVSFMSYRIYRISQTYTIKSDKIRIRSLIFDFFFIPFIQLGKQLSTGISQINVFLFIFDYLIETPFKEIFSFIEQWLFFLRRQREMLE